MIGKDINETIITELIAMTAMIVNLDIKLSTVSMTALIKYYPKSKTSVEN